MDLRGFLIALALATPLAHAQDTVGVDLVSLHAPSRAGQDNDNFGLHLILRDGACAGVYHNTLDRTSAWAGYCYQWGDWVLSGVLVSGYQRKEAPGVVAWSAERPPRITYYPGRTTGFTRGAVGAMAVVSYSFPEIAAGVRPAVSFVPGLMGASSVFHLSLEIRL